MKKVSKGEKGVRNLFRPLEEEHKLYEAIGPDFAPWVRIAILTGLRRGEQFGLRWADVDLEQGVLTLHRTKGGSVQYIHP